MSVFNSSPNDDPDMTIINHSFLYDRNDEPISSCIPVLRRSQQLNRSKSNDRQDYVYVDQITLGIATQIEQILNYYQKELKQESNTQLNCNQQLITRLIDFIRPAYSTNEVKLNNLDTLFEEISTLHNTKINEQKEKTDQLQNEIAHLKKLIITSTNDDDSESNTSLQIYRINSMVDYQQWMEIDEETRKLQNLVQAQRDRIDKLIELVSQTDINPSTQQSEITKKCYLCDYEFPPTCNKVEIISHMEKCTSLDSKQWKRPYCAKTNYIQQNNT